MFDLTVVKPIDIISTEIKLVLSTKVEVGLEGFYERIFYMLD